MEREFSRKKDQLILRDRLGRETERDKNKDFLASSKSMMIRDAKEQEDISMPSTGDRIEHWKVIS